MLKIIDLKNYNKNQNFLPTDYFFWLKNKSTESLIARYEIIKLSNFLPKVDIFWVPVFENNNYWSISHKKDLVFIAINKEPIWVDIEVFKNRSKEVLDIHKKPDYDLLWDKSLINFYKLWTIKESIIKLSLSWIDEIDKIKIISINTKNNCFFDIKFDLEIKSIFKNKNIISYCWINKDLIYSFSKFIK